MKVLHLAGTNRGATWMMEQLKGLKEQGHDVCAYVSGEGPLSDKLKDEQIDYQVVDLSMFWTIKESHRFFRSIFKLSWKIWNGRYDVVHAHLFPTMVISRIAAWIVDAPVRVSMIPGPFYIEAEIPSLIEKATVWMDSRVIASCQYTAELYREIGTPPSKIELVYYGADEKKFKPLPADQSTERTRLLQELDLPEETQLVGLVAYFYPKQCA
ncbi:MAG TPA: glycosyltransferase, partial [Candidatus Melainabacteria bacterium]|nr:glycosyltransferase [Candidatus Melainabacteria bacterium]